ncbi:MAG TPA: RNA-binding cell elongation regulator Jag/EloR [Anaerolineales bacterium]|nr:RNA-binding cell elongation regulator Jag/EloR [Anaerolineales bacterium]
MNQRMTLEIIAPTVEEALAQGLAELGLTADRVGVEVLDVGNKGLFKLGKAQVRVRLTVIPEGAESTEIAALSESQEEREANYREPQPASASDSQSDAEVDAVLETVESVVSKLIHLMHLEAQVSAHYNEQGDRHGIYVDVRGDDLGALIGRHSETLNAFQHVASLIVGKETQGWAQLFVDVEGYRDRREKQLIQMAKRMAEQVAKNGKKQSLEPMPSAERRIIHIALRDHPDVTTESAGEEPRRKVTIVPKRE